MVDVSKYSRMNYREYDMTNVVTSNLHSNLSNLLISHYNME